MPYEAPLTKYHFLVEVSDMKGNFSEISGLDFETEIIEYRAGSSNDFTKQKIPGMKKFTNVVMKRGSFTLDNGYFDWWNSVSLNKIRRENVIISLLNEKHEPVVVWSLINAWPTKVQSTDLKADDNAVAIESMELAHEGLTVAYV